MFDQNLDRKKFSIGDRVLVKYDSTNYPGKILQIVNNEFHINAMNKSGKFWRWPQMAFSTWQLSIRLYFGSPKSSNLTKEFSESLSIFSSIFCKPFMRSARNIM